MATLRLRGALYKSLRKVVQVVNDLVTSVNEQRTDHATFKALADELISDHATFKTAVDGIETLVEELHDDHATQKTLNDELIVDHGTFKTAVDGTELLIEEMYDDEEAKRNRLDYATADGVIGGDFTIAGTAAVTLLGAGHIRYRINGEEYYCDLDTTITLEDNGDIAQNKFGAWRILIDRLGAVTTQDTDAGGAMAYDNAEDALLCLSAVAPTANTCTIGYVTITDSGVGGFNIGTTNTSGGTATAVVYHVRGNPKQITGLHTALGAVTATGTTPERYSTGTKDVKINGVRIAQIAAEADKTFDDADTIAQSKFGAWLLVTNLAQSATYSLAADGRAGSVSAMAYDTEALAIAACDTLTDRLPPMFCPISVISVTNNLAGIWTANTDDVSGTDGSMMTDDATVGTWARATTTGFDSHKIVPPSIPAALGSPKPASGPATLTATAPATLTAPKPSSAPATLTATAPATLSAAAVDDLRFADSAP